jgi:hypothetical protein
MRRHVPKHMANSTAGHCGNNAAKMQNRDLNIRILHNIGRHCNYNLTLTGHYIGDTKVVNTKLPALVVDVGDFEGKDLIKEENKHDLFMSIMPGVSTFHTFPLIASYAFEQKVSTRMGHLVKKVRCTQMANLAKTAKLLKEVVGVAPSPMLFGPFLTGHPIHGWTAACESDWLCIKGALLTGHGWLDEVNKFCMNWYTNNASAKVRAALNEDFKNYKVCVVSHCQCLLVSHPPRKTSSP